MPSTGERDRESSDSRGRQRHRPYDFGAFRGYRGPRFTPIPDEFLDHQLADLSSAEAKVMLFLFRKTYGYRKSADRVSLAQLEHGTRSSDGTIIDRGTGLSRATIWRALKGLQQKGLIEVQRQTTLVGDADINYYHIREDGGLESGDKSRESGGRRRRTAGSGGEESGTDMQGSFSNETTPSSELNHSGFRTKPGGGFGSEPTRTDFTREDSTHEVASDESQVSSRRKTTKDDDRQDWPSYEAMAREFLKAIGYAKPAGVKKERTVRVLQELQREGDYTLDELRAACEIAASMGARGPELIPHVIGRTAPTYPEAEVGERLSQQEEQERIRWQSLAAQFEALPHNEQQELLAAARSSSPILAERPLDHPLVRAAAIGMLGER